MLNVVFISQPFSLLSWITPVTSRKLKVPDLTTNIGNVKVIIY